MIERLKGTFNIGLVGWLCLPALTLSLVLSVPSLFKITAMAGGPIAGTGQQAQNMVLETLLRDISIMPQGDNRRRELSRSDPFEIAESYINWLPRRMLRDRQVICLAKNIWHESRGEPAHGQLAVGLVTLNRMESHWRPKTACEVVYEPSQFSWTMVPSLRNAKPAGHQWEQIVLLSATLLHRRDLFDDITHGATYFHANYVRPGWNVDMKRTARLGAHVFYRPKIQDDAW